MILDDRETLLDYGNDGNPPDDPAQHLALMKALGGAGSGNFGHAGRPGEVGGSSETTHVGITSSRGPDDPTHGTHSNKTTFAAMREFTSQLQQVSGVRNVKVEPGHGVYHGDYEPTWVVSYTGNGAAERLLASTGQHHNQDSVLFMRAPKNDGTDMPLAEWRFAHGVDKSRRDKIAAVMTQHGIDGGTWYREGKYTVLRSVAVPEWGADADSHTTNSHALSAAMRAIAPHSLRIRPVSVKLLSRDGAHPYQSVIRGAAHASRTPDTGSTREESRGSQNGLFGPARSELQRRAAGIAADPGDETRYDGDSAEEEVAFRFAKKSRRKSGPFEYTFDAANAYAAQWAREHATELIDGISDTTRRRIIEAVAFAQETGAMREAYEEILDAVGNAKRAQLIARTEAMMAANAGNRFGWDQAVDEGLLPPDSQRVWIATSDACPFCTALDGKHAPLDGQYPSPGGDGPPLHPNSVIAGTTVEGNTIAATRMSYSGDVVEITTVDGRNLTVTPNHSVATLRGFILARELNEFDHLLSYDERVVRQTVDAITPSVDTGTPLSLPDNKQNTPPAIEHVFDAIQLAGRSVLVKRFGNEFHGDAAYGNSDIDVVFSDIVLGDHFESALLEQQKRFNLEPPNLSSSGPSSAGLLDERLAAAQSAFVPRLRPVVEPSLDTGIGTVAQENPAFDETSGQSFTPQTSLQRKTEQGVAGLVTRNQIVENTVRNSDSSESHTFKVGATSNLDAVLLELLSESTTRDACFVRELEQRLPRLVTRSKVSHVHFREYVGHVYDLSTVSGVIVAAHFIISNCRCTEGLTGG